MGKRTYNNNNDSSRKKYKVSSTIIDPGQHGIFATCNRHKEPSAAKELKGYLQDKLDVYFPKQEEEEKDSDNKEDKKEELSIEDAIKQELEELNSSNKDSVNKDIIREIKINCDSMVFIKTRKPIVASEFVVKLCDELKNAKKKSSRFLQKLTPVDGSCNATKSEFEKLIRIMLEKPFKELQAEQEAENKLNAKTEEDNEEKSQSAEAENKESEEPKNNTKRATYGVNLVKRNFHSLERDEVNEIIQNYAKEFNLLPVWRNPQILVNVFGYKNFMGVSYVDGEKFDSLSKFNIQQIYEKLDEIKKVNVENSRVAASGIKNNLNKEESSDNKESEEPKEESKEETQEEAK